MVMSWIYTGIMAISVISALILGTGPELAAAVPAGAQAGITLAVSMAGSLCLWTGAGKLMERIGLTEKLSFLMRPLLYTLFPSAKQNASLRASLSANICANLLGLGNAATPMGILSAKQMADPAAPRTATDELCRLIVLNTASIQLIPVTVAAVRVNLGSSTPFDILPAVWLTSLCSAGFGVAAAWLLGKVWPHD